MPRLTIMRGVSGSGKSTHARSLGADVVLASDDYFDALGRWMPEREAEAHHWNFERCIDAMKSHVPHIVIDCVNAAPWEWEKYTLIADRYGYSVEWVQMHRLGCDVTEFFERCIHDVPLDKIHGQMCRMINSGADYYVNL